LVRERAIKVLPGGGGSEQQRLWGPVLTAPGIFLDFKGRFAWVGAASRNRNRQDVDYGAYRDVFTAIP